ncbi:MAG: response regulator [Desulfovibrionaceae bacterium]|nr:response regulator [Desulfovibrionaceae bacterium]
MGPNNKDHKIVGNPLGLFVIFFLISASAVAGIMTTFYYSQAGNIISGFETNEKHAVTLQKRTIAALMDMVADDVLFLSNQSALDEYLATGSPTALGRIEKDFSALAGVRKKYDQIRFLDAAGMEVVRVNGGGDYPFSVPPSELQNKSGRYYFTDSLRLKHNEVYMSPLDLNVEHGIIEIPLKPMIRFGTPVFDSSGRKRGVVLINFKAQTFLDAILTAAGVKQGRPMLLNKQGYWLLSDNLDDEFGFMFEDRKDRTFAKRYPQEWEQIHEAKHSGQILSDNGLFSFSRIYPLLTSRQEMERPDESVLRSSAGANYYWLLVTHVSPGTLHAALGELRSRVLLLGLGLVAVMLIVSWFLARGLAERKRVLQTLRANQQQLQTIIAYLPGVFILKDRDGRYLLVNKFFEEATGFSAGEILGKTDDECMPPEMAAPIMAMERNALREGKALTFEEEVPHPDGTPHTYLTTKVPLLGAKGEVDLLLVLATDITDRRRMEQELVEAKEVAEKATRAKSDFLANMSHEIRTPMNAILGMAYLALRTDLSPTQMDYLKKINFAAKSLLEIINDILDFSKIEAGMLKLEHTEFHLEEVLTNLISFISVPAQEKNLELLTFTAPEVRGGLVGDPLRLGQVLTNLATNAVKFTDKGEILIRVEEEESTDDTTVLRFEVRDTGIGMSDKQVKRVFTAFSQADVSTTRKFGGTGLGLSISKQLVSMMGGEIGVTSEPGAGSTFWFTARFGIHDKAAREFKPTEAGQGLKVLVADDNKTARDILYSTLKSFGFEPATASSGAEALDMLEVADPPYRLALLDWRMPGMDGLEVAKRIKENPRIKEPLSILMVTAYAREEVMRETERLGLNGCLIKPVNQSVLFNTIMEALGEAARTIKPQTRNAGLLEEARGKVGGAKVLLAEDNDINRQVASEILTQARLDVRMAENGQAAVDMAGEEDFDLILMDIQMPEMDGMEAARRIRASSRNSQTPILAMTAHAMSGDDEKSLAAGMNGHLTKPIDVDKLYAALLRWIAPRNKADAPGPTDSTDGNEIELPNSLQGFDFAAGLARVGGNKGLYRKLLLTLRDEYADTPDTIGAALKSGDYAEAEHLAHSVKGMAGNLGATELFMRAQDLEQAAKSRAETECTSALAAFKAVFAEAVQALAVIPSARENPAERPHSASRAELAGALDAMRDALQSNTVQTCQEALAEMLALQWPDSLLFELSELNKAVGKYDFKQASAVAKTMESKLKE